MDPHDFDSITRLFAQRRLARRKAVSRASAAVVVAGVSGHGLASANAQEATSAQADRNGTTGPEMLFVQSFESGRIVPKDGYANRYTVTLEHGLGQTIYFSDRPDRIVGTSPTQRFLDGIGFTPDNPPNAAIITDNGDGESTLAVVELFAPEYDELSATMTYDLAVLDHWEDSRNLGFTQTPVDLGTVSETFGAAHLFIDDCPTGDIYCVSVAQRIVIGTIESSTFGGHCFSSTAESCLPCAPWHETIFAAARYWEGVCDDMFPDCEHACSASGVFWIDPNSE